MNRRILLIDDEKQTMRRMRGSLINNGYKAFYSCYEQEALDIINTQSIDMVVLYMQQINSSSFDLLKEIKENHPLALRVVISGYEDETLVMKILGGNLAKLFLMNPVKEHEFIELINHLFEVEEILRDKKILLAINSIDDLPTIDNVYNNVSNLISKDADVTKIAKVIQEDQSMAAKVLHVANSAFYGIKTASINTAINYLGLSNIKNIILLSNAFDYLKGNEFKYEKELLWNHANQTNKIVTQIYKSILKKEISDSFALAGLFHDIGKLVLLKNYPNEYREILRIRSSEDADDINIEKRFLSVSHEDVGGYLLNWWELPHPVIEATLFHHDPLNNSVINKQLTSVIYIANYYAWIKTGTGIKKKINDDVFDYIGISREECNTFFM